MDGSRSQQEDDVEINDRTQTRVCSDKETNKDSVEGANEGGVETISLRKEQTYS